MARTHVQNYSLNSNNMTNKTTTKKKSSDGSASTHSSHSNSNHDDGRRSKVATSMRKFLAEDDDFDYLGSLTSKSSDIPKNSTSSRKRQPISYRKKTSTAGRPGIPRSRSGSSTKPESRRSNPRSIRKSSTEYEGNLNDTKAKDSSVKNLMSSARKLIDKGVRAVSPGRLRRERSQSPGPMKNRNSVRASKSASPKSSRTDDLTASPSSPTTKKKSRSKSPGRLKKRDGEGSEAPRSSKGRARSKSPGKMKSRTGRSKSPGKMKNRSSSPGALRRTDRPRRRPENRDENGTSRRSRSSGPLKKEKSSRSRRDNTPSKPIRSTRSNDELDGEMPIKKDQSYSNMQDELNRYKVKRNKSMDHTMARQARRDANSISDDEDKAPPRRAESMMLSREMGRRGKSNSLADLVQYKEEEIHSTSYFASNHVLVNRERMKRGLRPLTRNVAMDNLARKSAEEMASSKGLKAHPTTYVGNVLRGDTIRSIHRATMLQKQGRERANILNPYFQDFGVGTCKGGDGQLYMCQLFSERLELALTDTANMNPEDD